MTMSLMAGFVAGLIHVFAGPDHLAAIGPLSLHHGKGAWKLGFKWGLGHATGVALIAVLSLVLRQILPLEEFSSFSERMVGVLLIGIGIWGMHKACAHQVHSHAHTHDGVSHFHIHVHGPKRSTHERHMHAAFGVGALHGFAGSSHLLGLLPALALPNAAQSISYLIGFGLGTIFAMTSFSSVAGWVASRFGSFGTGSYRVLMAGCCSASLCLGVYWLVA